MSTKGQAMKHTERNVWGVRESVREKLQVGERESWSEMERGGGSWCGGRVRINMEEEGRALIMP